MAKPKDKKKQSDFGRGFKMGSGAGKRIERERQADEKEFSAKRRSDERSNRNRGRGSRDFSRRQGPGTGSLTSYGQERTGLTPGAMIPTWRDTRNRLHVTAFGDTDFLIVRTAILDPVTQLAAYIGDANGIGNLVDSESSAALIKDWVAPQRTSFLESIFYGFQLLHQLGMQVGYRQILKLATESDVGWHWTQETFDAFLNALEARNLYIPALSVALAQSVNLMYRVEMADPLKDRPASMYSPWKPTFTLANAQTCRDAIYTRQAQALLHAAKAELPMVKVTRALVESCFRFKDLTWDNFDLEFCKNQYLYVDDNLEAADRLVIDDVANVNNVFMDNMTTVYTGVSYFWIGERASDIIGIARIMHPYEATNNIMGMLSVTSGGANNVSVEKWGQDDNAGTVVTFSEFVARADATIEWGGLPLYYMISSAVDTDGQAPAIWLNTDKAGDTNYTAQGNTNVSLFLLESTLLSGKDSWVKTGVSFAELRDIELRVLSYMLKGRTTASVVP